MKIKKIKIRLFQNEIERVTETGEDLVVTTENSYSIQNAKDPIPVLTIALDKEGCLMINTNSRSFIAEKLAERIQG